MNKLCEVGSPAVAVEIITRLDEESIPAEVTHNVGAALFGRANRFTSQNSSIIWIRDAKDLHRASEIADDVRSIQLEAAHCPGCGYDLKGHFGEGSCPECGGPVNPPDDDTVPCGGCGEENPTNFDKCWNCGESVADESLPRPPDSRSGIRPRCEHCDEVLQLGFEHCGACGAVVQHSAGRPGKLSMLRWQGLWLLVLVVIILLFRLVFLP